MKIRLALIGALALFDLMVAVLISLGEISPQAAVGLLLANPLVVTVDNLLRARRVGVGARQPGAWPAPRL